MTKHSHTETIAVIFTVLLGVFGIGLAIYSIEQADRACAAQTCPSGLTPIRMKGQCVCFMEAK